MNIKTFATTTVIIFASTYLSEANAASSRWSLSVGPAWRSQVDIDTAGHITPATAPNVKDGVDLSRSEIAPVADPMAGQGGIPEDGLLWGYSDSYADLNGAAWSKYSVDYSDDDSPIGVNFAACYDAYQGETISIGINLRFAAYWNMKSSTSAGYDTWRNDYVYETGIPPESMTDTAWEDSVDRTIDIETLYNTTKTGSGFVTTRFKGDLYQIGIGPKITWHALDCLDIYGGVEGLCNISHTRLSTSEGTRDFSSTDTDCLFGVGGNIGFTGWMTENIGFYGQVGYEWIDDTDVSAGGFNTEIDYSSLVVSAGIVFSF